MSNSLPPVFIVKNGPPPEIVPGERLRLVVAQGKNLRRCFCLVSDLITLGREACTITLDDAGISRKHVELRWVGDHYLAKDLGSANGFIVNNQKFTSAALRPGDVFILGLTVFNILAPGQIALSAGNKNLSPEQRKQLRSEQAKIAKNRLLVLGGLLFLLWIAFSPSEQIETFRNRGNIAEPDAQPQKKLDPKAAKEAIKEYLPDYALNTPQRRDAEIFFRQGVRELQNKNYRRSINAFDTALTVDPSHDLAKRYLKSAKKDFEEEIKAAFLAGTQARKSMRYKEARTHYENILRYLEGDTLNPKYIESQEALKQLDKEENKNQ